MVALHRTQHQQQPRPRRPHLRIVAAQEYALVRHDALPEHTDYRDTGCDLAASCLACPFARCQYDESPSGRRLEAEKRDREIVYIRRRHRAPINMLAATYGLSRRSIFRILREQADRERGLQRTGRRPR